MRLSPLFQLRDSTKGNHLEDQDIYARFRSRLFFGSGYRKLIGDSPEMELFCFTLYILRLPVIAYVMKDVRSITEGKLDIDRRIRLFFFNDALDMYKQV